MKDDFEKTLSNLNPKDMTKAELEQLILKVKEDTYKQTIDYLEKSGYIDPLGAWAKMRFFKQANYNAQEGLDKKNAYFEEIGRKLFPEDYNQ